MGRDASNQSALLIIGLLFGAISGGITGYFMGHGLEFKMGELEELKRGNEDGKIFASEVTTTMALEFNERIENVKSEWRNLCNIAPDNCDRNALNAALTALDTAKIDESGIRELVGLG